MLFLMIMYVHCEKKYLDVLESRTIECPWWGFICTSFLSWLSSTNHRWVSSTPFGIYFHLLVNSRTGLLFHSSFANDKFRRISTTFQQHCNIWLLWFTLISFTVLKWDNYSSVQLPFELPVQIAVQLLLELELNWS